MIKGQVKTNPLQGKYSSDNYARIKCNLCGNKNVDIILPGKPFNSIKPCKCQEKPKVIRRTTPIKKAE